MTWRDGQFGRRSRRLAPRGDHARMPAVLEQLREDHRGRCGSSPDLTRRIMGRLGYMQSHRRSLSRWSQRGVFLLLAAATLAIGMHVFRNSDASRSPNGPTIPTALIEDVARQRQRLEHLHDSIRSIANPNANPNGGGGGGAGLFRLPTGDSGNQRGPSPVDSGDEDGGWNPQPDDTQWLAVGPVRWS